MDGYGLGYLIRWMTKSALDDGLLVQVLQDWTPPYPGLCLYYLRHRHLSASMRAFVYYLRDQAGQLRTGV
jgi:DNA-binding transcriptional LysR family regulator